MSSVLEFTPEEEAALRVAAKGQDISAFLKSLALAMARKLTWTAVGEAATQEGPEQT